MCNNQSVHSSSRYLCFCSGLTEFSCWVIRFKFCQERQLLTCYINKIYNNKFVTTGSKSNNEQPLEVNVFEIK